MIFKDGSVQQEVFLKYNSPNTENMRAHKIIVGVARVLDAVSNYILDEGEIVITSAVRPPRDGKPSFHPVGQAFDLRTKDRSDQWIEDITSTIIALKSIDPNLGFLFESKDLPQEHLHIQYRRGKPL